jgi:O-acetyl-ADP-ribose deacetylase (regulator of RNase III)
MRPISERLSVVQDDITTLTVDAIVNAANSRLMPGGGVDGAINKAAGPELGAAMMAIGRCPPGEAVITAGFRLPAKHVIHTVAPVYAQHKPDEVWRLLTNCYRNALAHTLANSIHSIAFPCLGTGVYGIPAGKACEVAVASVVAHCEVHALPNQVIFCCFGKIDAELYRAALAGLRA